jgi:hypothetical protein
LISAKRSFCHGFWRCYTTDKKLADPESSCDTSILLLIATSIALLHSCFASRMLSGGLL